MMGVAFTRAKLMGPHIDKFFSQKARVITKEKSVRTSIDIRQVLTQDWG